MAFRIRNNNLLKMTSMEYFCSGELGALASDTSHSCLRIYTNFPVVFADNNWITSLSGSFSVP